MGYKRAKYEEIRNQMKPGDVIAFGGYCFMSDVIKWVCRSNVSHSGVILQTKLMIDDNPQDGFFNQIIESTELNGFMGVQINRMSERLSYDGDIWWLPLKKECREKLNQKAFFDFLIHQVNKKFDIPDSVELMIDNLLHIDPHIKDDYSKFFCSELVVAGLEAGGVLPNLDAAEITPRDLCKFDIYEEDYYQLKGDKDKKIKGYNSKNPALWM